MGVFERMLVALRERIPIKMEQEVINLRGSSRGGGGGGSGGKQKDKVDVFRGSKFFFFSTLFYYKHPLKDYKLMKKGEEVVIR